MKTLILYTTKHGATAEIARRISSTVTSKAYLKAIEDALNH